MQNDNQEKNHQFMNKNLISFALWQSRKENNNLWTRSYFLLHYAKNSPIYHGQALQDSGQFFWPSTLLQFMRPFMIQFGQMSPAIASTHPVAAVVAWGDAVGVTPVDTAVRGVVPPVITNIREIARLPQWLLQLQSQLPVKFSTDFYPLRMRCNLSVTLLSVCDVFTDREFPQIFYKNLGFKVFH